MKNRAALVITEIPQTFWCINWYEFLQYIFHIQ